jgi:exodeoxyribonuclease-3
MRIITFNANGVRSAANKGFFDWLKKQSADVVCLQETKSQEDQLSDPMFRPDGHHCFYRDATSKKGYSGVAIYSRREPDEVRTALGWAPFDDEGRYIEARYGKLSVVSLYVPSGSSGDERQQFKFKVMDWFKPVLDEWLASGRDYVLCGDWNIGHTENDIKAWKANQKKAGFLPAERQWVTDLLATGWVDVVRAMHPDVAGPYSWWSWRGKAFDNDAGWRIDYQLANPTLAEKVVAARVERAELYALRWSDHAPVTVEYA